MPERPANTSSGRKRGKLWLVFLFAACFAAGAAYLGLQPMDWEKLAPLPKAEIKAPTKQALAPARIAPSFDAVTADESGSLVAAGKAEPGATVLLQNEGQTLGETRADEHGEWVLMLEHPLAPGHYDLSLQAAKPETQDRVAGQHKFALTIAPRETPASGPARIVAASPPKAGAASPPAAAPAAIRPGPAASEERQAKQPAMAAVKRGDTLWGMARRFYGNGVRYSEIAGANKEQIKNPNLIFPNQQLAIPADKAP